MEMEQHRKPNMEKMLQQSEIFYRYIDKNLKSSQGITLSFELN